MATKKPAAPKPLSKVEQLERQIGNLEEALYMAYNDTDELFGSLYLIVQELEKPDCNRYMVKSAVKALRSLLIANQMQMMDCAGLEY
jgi:hypothetical protein